MDETGGFLRFQGHHLDPTAQEFFPSPASTHMPLVSPQIYYTYPYPPLFCEYSTHQAYVCTAAAETAAAAAAAAPPAAAAAPLLQASLPPPLMTPSRALLLSLVPADVSESIIRRELEAFGDVRAVQMDRVRDGIVTVHFYDLRHAQAALVEIQEQHMQQQCRLRRHYDAFLGHNSFGFAHPPPPPPLPPPARGLISGRAVWAQFTVPVFCNIPDGCNQGTLVIFNLDPSVSSTSLQQMFEPFGPVKELRGTPMKKHQRFVEFYDTRDAAKALGEMNGKEIKGKGIVIEFSRPGGYSKRLSRGNSNKFNPMNHYNSCSNSPQFSPPPPPTPPPLPQRKVSVAMPVSRKSSFSTNPNGNGGSKGLLIEDSMAALSINAYGCEESSSKMKSIKRNSKKASNSSGKQQLQQQEQHQQKPKSSRLWKGSARQQQAKEYDPRFLINEDAIMESNFKDSRTTVMIKNIPNKYSQKLLLNMLDNHCIHCNEQIADGDDQPLSSYDFVYLPIDFINKCNVGYGFVNMTSPEATWRLYKAFHLRSWEVFNSRKICEVTYARLQGVEALQDHFKNSKFPCDADEYLPVIFSPPRDGRQLTEPVPIVGRNSIDHPLPLLSSSLAFSSNQDHSETSYDNIDDDDEMGGQDFLEQEVNEGGAEHIDYNDDDGQDMGIDGGGGGVGRGGSSHSGGDSEDQDLQNDNDDI